MADIDNKEFREKVEGVLNKIRPSLQADGGNVKLIDVNNDGDVSVKLQGACGACPFAQITLKMSIERQLKKEIPEVKSVKAV
ncbi:MAG: NifU family protein [Candidatus Cloacimonadia bacterium]